MTDLTEQQRAVLGIESRFWRHAGAKEDAIRAETGLSPTRFYQALNAMRVNTAAWEHAPATMGRVDRLLGRRARQHAGE